MDSGRTWRLIVQRLVAVRNGLIQIITVWANKVLLIVQGLLVLLILMLVLSLKLLWKRGLWLHSYRRMRLTNSSGSHSCMHATWLGRGLTYCCNIKFSFCASSRSILLFKICSALLIAHNVSACLVACRWRGRENLLHGNVVVTRVKPLVICELSCRSTFCVHLVTQTACSVQATFC